MHSIHVFWGNLKWRCEIFFFLFGWRDSTLILWCSRRRHSSFLSRTILCWISLKIKGGWNRGWYLFIYIELTSQVTWRDSDVSSQLSSRNDTEPAQKCTNGTACFRFPTNGLFLSLIRTCMPASSVPNSLVNNKKALIVLPRGRSVLPPVGERHPLHLKRLRPSIRTVPFWRTQTNMRRKVCVCVCSTFLTGALNDQHPVRIGETYRGEQ